MSIVLFKEWLCTECGKTWEHVRGGRKPRRCDDCSKAAPPSEHREEEGK